MFALLVNYIVHEIVFKSLANLDLEETIDDHLLIQIKIIWTVSKIIYHIIIVWLLVK